MARSKSSQSSEEGGSFWISYSDLSTGLMIAFMLVMLLMVILQKQQGEDQTDRVADIVRKIEIMLGQKSKLGGTINEAFQQDQTINADPVTAQLSIDERLLTFNESSSLLKPEGYAFLDRFTPIYFCALWSHEIQECEGCRRLDPERPGGIRRIQVTGHADMKGKFHTNHQLSSERAESVVQYMLAVLRCADGTQIKPCPKEVSIPDECKGKSAKLLGYAEERLWAIGAGETQHCTAELNALKVARPVERCDAIVRSGASYRKVNFALELTGDDMTGLLADLVALRKTVGSRPEGKDIDVLASLVAEECWTAPHKYHGCRTFIEDCLVAGEEDPQCTGLYGNLENEDTLKVIKEICATNTTAEGCSWIE